MEPESQESPNQVLGGTYGDADSQEIGRDLIFEKLMANMTWCVNYPIKEADFQDMGKIKKRINEEFTETKKDELLLKWETCWGIMISKKLRGDLP